MIKELTIENNAAYLKDAIINGEPFKFPKGILDKQITNCGGTTLAIEEECNTVICCPRRNLIENKKAQYNNLILLEGGINIEDVKKQILDTVGYVKIICTYDSFYKLEDIIDKDYHIVIDEYQTILGDCGFRDTVLNKFLDAVLQYDYYTFMSATPIPEKFLNRIHKLSGLDKYKLIWQSVDKVNIVQYQTKNPIGIVTNLVNSFITGEYLPTLDDGIQSKECVIFLNSVTNIVNIIRHLKLSPEDVNIIVADNEDNKYLIKKLGDRFCRGTLPIKGEPNKKVTFCTSTAYYGCDFYSDCATTFVVSDCNSQCKTIDIQTELPQIAGRQRNSNNPFAKEIYLIYNVNNRDIDEETFNNELNLAILADTEIIQKNSNLSEDAIERFIKLLSNKDNSSFICYDGTKLLLNDMAILNTEYRYWNNRQYSKYGIWVKKQINDTNQLESTGDVMIAKTETFVKSIIKRNSFEDRLKRLVELKEMPNTFSTNYELATSPMRFGELQEYIDKLDISTIKHCSYQKSKLDAEILNKSKQYKLNQINIANYFSYDEFLTGKQIKTRLQHIYDSLGINKKAKTKDLENYGLSLRYTSRSIDGTKQNGYVIQ